MRVLPGGVLGGYYAPQELAFVVREARGPRLYDFSGREYIDYILGSGPLVLGHAHPAVVAAVETQLRKGTTYFQLSEPTLALAEEICRAVPCAEQIRFCGSGSEATFFALRVARAFRQRDKILKFEGGFHGVHDYSLMSVGPRTPKAFPAPTPDSAGIPHSIQGEVLVAPFNDVAEAQAMIEAHHHDLAAVIMEPLQRLVVPQPGFLQGVREITARHGVPLIFDEIVTGFRFAYGGAQEYYGVVPDLAAFGKIIGGGFPLAAVAGRRDIMRHFSQEMSEGGFVQQAGTLNGNPIAAAAGLATLAELRRPGTYERLFATGRHTAGPLAHFLPVAWTALAASVMPRATSTSAAAVSVRMIMLVFDLVRGMGEDVRPANGRAPAHVRRVLASEARLLVTAERSERVELAAVDVHLSRAQPPSYPLGPLDV